MPPAKPADDLDDLERAALAAIEALRRMTPSDCIEQDWLREASSRVAFVARRLRLQQEGRDA